MVVGVVRRARPRTPWTLQSTKPGTASRGPCRATGVAVNHAPQTPPGSMSVIACSRLLTLFWKKMPELSTLYRPVGQAEFDLVRASGYRSFPPRLQHQPIFYPVLSEQYA